MPATSSRWSASRTPAPATRCAIRSKPVILERMDFPEPVIEMAVEPKTKADQEKMAMALRKLATEDPSFRVSTDQESGQTIIKGMGELHLDIKVDILKRTHKVEVNVGAPQVAYRETISRAVDIDYTHKKQTGGTGQFARVKFNVEPNEPGKGFEFESKIIGGSVPKEYIPGVEKGLELGHGRGRSRRLPGRRRQGRADRRRLPRSRLVGVWRSKSRRAQALREALQKGGSVLLEPIMKVEVVTPEEYTGSVIGDLNSRRGQIQGQDMRGNASRRERDGAARQHVRLREQPAFVHAGSRQLHDAVRPLRRKCRATWPRRSRPSTRKTHAKDRFRLQSRPTKPQVR